MVNWFLQIGILFGTVLLLVVSIAWVDLLAQIRTLYPLFQNKLASQVFYVAVITIIGLGFLAIFNPFGTTEKTPVGSERALLEDHLIRFPILREI